MNFFESLKYCIACQRFFGVTLLTVDKSGVKLTWSSRLLPLLWSTLYYIFLIYFIFVDSGLTYFGTDINIFVVIANLQLFVTVFTFSTNFVATLFKQFQELAFYQSLYEFDQQMIVKFHVDFRYLDFKRRSGLSVLISLGHLVLVLLTLGINIGLSENKLQMFYFAAAFIQFSNLSTLSLSYCFTMFLLKTRYEILDKCVVDYGHTVWKFEDLIKMRRQLNRSIEQINSVYGFKQLINLLNDFLVLTINVYALCIMLRQQETLTNLEMSVMFMNLFSLVSTVGKVMMACCCAQIVVNKVNLL
jgi:hypothetical protein